MKENKILIDTNIVIYHLSGDHTLERLLTDKLVYLSFMSEVELRSKPSLNKQDELILDNYISNMYVIHSNDRITKLAAHLRRTYQVKVADAIIAATSLFMDVPLVSADQQLLKMKEVDTIAYHPAIK